MSLIEKFVFLGYVAVWGLFYVPFFLMSKQWLLLVITTWAVLIWAWTLLRRQCARCYRVSYPLNRVPADVREDFFHNYRLFAEAQNKPRNG